MLFPNHGSIECFQVLSSKKCVYEHLCSDFFSLSTCEGIFLDYIPRNGYTRE